MSRPERGPGAVYPGSAGPGARRLQVVLLVLLSALVPLVGCRGPTPGPTRAPAPRPSLAAFQADVDEVLQRLPVPGMSVAVARGDSIVWSRGYGVADAGSGREATASTPYRIGSITKPITATVLLRLAERGALELDTAMAAYLSDPPDWARRVTVREVMQHTSEAEPPGSWFTYSGRYNVLSLVAEGAAGRPFPELVRELVLEPAGMTSSAPVATLDPASDLARRLARPHAPDGTVAGPGSVPDVTTGGNGIIASAEDLARFAGALGAGRLLEPGSVRAAWTPAPAPSSGGALPYGLGWFVESAPLVDLVAHGGQWPTYSGLLLHVPEQELTLAVLANSWHVSRPYYTIGTGTVLFNALAASFLRKVVLPSRGVRLPDPGWDAGAAELAAEGAELDAPLRYHWGTELFGRGLLAREAGREERADSLLLAAVECCREALEASEDLGLLFHLGRSGDPRLRAVGQEAGERRRALAPGDRVTRFHLGVSYGLDGDLARSAPLLESLIDDDGAPAWLRGWAAYTRAQQLQDEDPDRAAALLEAVLERGVDESGLLGEARSLLDELRRGPRPRVHLIATGGTISNTDDDGRLDGEEIVAGVPGLDEVAELSVEQFSNIPSGRMTPTLWLDLARRVEAVFRERPGLSGVVITHGTDTMEETAYFLELVLGPGRPVAVTGAMRNSSRLSSDGPANLHNAVRYLVHPSAAGRGVVVVMNDLALPAREATKSNTSRVNAFHAGRRGPVAVLDPDTVAFVEPVAPRPTRLLDPDTVEALPRVDIIYSYAGADGTLVDAAVEAGAAGLVMGAVGRGGLTPGQSDAVDRARARGVHVVASSRTLGGRVPVGSYERATRDRHSDEGLRFGAGDLTPQKARILLMLALAVTDDPAGLLEVFRAR